MSDRRPGLGRALLIAALIAACCSPASAAATITGRVRNRTATRLAAGDDVILLRLVRGKGEEEARTKTDALGSFVLNVRYPGDLHLVRVVHQGVTYDRGASVGDTLSLEVFEAVPAVQGVTGIAEIIRVGSRGQVLHVSDMYDIRNGSSPPMTQAGERAFELYVPAAATIESVLAADAGGVGVLTSAAAVPGEPGHYTVNFPLRPGDTKFAVNYDVPYDGHARFHHKIRYPTQQVAIMLPATMSFTSIPPGPSGFHLLAASDATARVQAMNAVESGELPEFEISGNGSRPALTSETAIRLQSPSPAVAASASSLPDRPGSPDLRKGDLASPRRPSAPASIRDLVIALFFLGCGLLVWRIRFLRQWKLRRTL